MVVGAGVIVTRSPAAGKKNRAGQEEQQGGHREEVHSPKESVCLHCSMFARFGLPNHSCERPEGRPTLLLTPQKGKSLKKLLGVA
jgi:hypothetical protein